MPLQQQLLLVAAADAGEGRPHDHPVVAAHARVRNVDERHRREPGGEGLVGEEPERPREDDLRDVHLELQGLHLGPPARAGPASSFRPRGEHQPFAPPAARRARADARV